MASNPALEDCSENASWDFVAGTTQVSENLASLLDRVCEFFEVATELPGLSIPRGGSELDAEVGDLVLAIDGFIEESERWTLSFPVRKEGAFVDSEGDPVK